MDDSHHPELNDTKPANLTRPVLIIFALLIILQIIGALNPGYLCWGFNFWSILSFPLSVIFPLLALIFFIPPVNRFLLTALTPVIDLIYRPRNKTSAFIIALALSVIFLSIFYFFRSRAHVYGDGYMILSAFSGTDTLFNNYQDYLKSLSYLFQTSAYTVISYFFTLSPEEGFAFINALGGVFGFWAIYKLTGILSRDSLSRTFMLLACFSCATLILFFGYLEYYTWVTAWSLWSLYYALKYLTTRSGLIPLLLFSLLAVGFHILALPFLITALLAVIYNPAKTSPLPFNLSFKTLNLSLIALSILIALTAQLASLPQWLMLLSPIEGVPYWFLAPSRILDLINLCLLVAPVGTMLFIFWIFSRSKKQTSPLLNLLGTAVLMSFLVAFWVEPKLGAARDWDFSSFFAFPLTLWALAWYLNLKDFSLKDKTLLILPALVTALVIITPNLIEKNDLHLASKHLDRILWDSPHHQKNYGEARRTMVWGVTLYNNAGEIELAIPNLYRRIDANPTSYAALFKLGEYFYEKNELDSTALYFSKAVQYSPPNPMYFTRLAEVFSKLGKYPEALACLEQSEKIEPEKYNTQFLYGVILTKIDRLDDALAHFHHAQRLEPESFMPPMNIGLIYTHRQQYDSAYVYLKQSMKIHPGNELILNPLVESCLALGKNDEVNEILKSIRNK